MRYLIGVGTYYGFDDSIGLRVVEAVAARRLDRGFVAVELGGNVLDLVHYLDEDTEEVLVVDTAKMGKPPGEFAFFEAEDVATNKPVAGISTHEADVLKVLELVSSLGNPLPRVTFLGIEPAELKTEMGLSTTLEARFDEYVETAVGYFREVHS